MTEQVEVVIIGGGQAGLALSYYLTQQGRTHLVLEQGQVGVEFTRFCGDPKQSGSPINCA